MDIEQLNGCWREAFPNAALPDWPVGSEDVGAALLASEVRLQALQEEVRREQFFRRCLKMVQSVGMASSTDSLAVSPSTSTAAAEGDSADTSRAVAAEKDADGSFIRREAEPPTGPLVTSTPIRRESSRQLLTSGAGLLTPDDSQLSPSSSFAIDSAQRQSQRSSSGYRKLARRRKVSNSNMAGSKRLVRPVADGDERHDSSHDEAEPELGDDEEGEVAERKALTTGAQSEVSDAAVSPPSAISRMSPSTRAAHCKSLPTGLDASCYSTADQTSPTSVGASRGHKSLTEGDVREHEQAQMQFNRLSGDARKMLLGVRRRRGSDGSIVPYARASRRGTSPQLQSPSEKYLPSSLYPASLVSSG